MEIKNLQRVSNMKRYMVVSALIVSAVISGLLIQRADASFQSEALTDGAVSHWSFEESMGDLIDQIGTVNGEVLGTSQRQVSAHQGNGYSFSGSSSQGVSLPDNIFNSHSEGAIEAIVKIDSTSGDYIIFSQGDSTTSGGYQIALSIRDGRARLHVRPTTAYPISITGNTVLDTNQYYHIVAQVGISGMQLFVNGSEDTPYTTSGDRSINSWFYENSQSTVDTLYGIGYLNRGSPTGHFNGVIDELAIYDEPKTQTVWARHYSEIFGSVGPSDISINSPSAYSVYQRDGDSLADVTVSGDYSGVSSAVEYQVDGGSWSVLDSSLSEGEFSGTITDLAAGEHTIAVRLADATSTTDTVSDVRVGDVFGWIGQSNQDGRFGSEQPYTGQAASVFDRDGSWLNLTSGYQSPVASGHSVLPRLASLIEAKSGVPVGFVAETQGMTGLVAPDPDWAIGGSNYNYFINAINDSGVNNLKAILWYQGGREISNGISQSVYEVAEQGLLNNIQSDTGFTDVPMLTANKAMQDGKVAENINNIRLAKIANWDNANDIHPGPTGHDQIFNDGSHWSSNSQAATLAQRWWRTIDHSLYGGEQSPRGPQFDSAQYTGSSLTVAFKGGEGSLTNQSDTTGWRVVDAAGTRTIQSATGTSNTVTLTLDQALVEPVVVTFAHGNDAGGSTMVDSGTYPLPPEPFISKTATSFAQPNTPPTISGAPAATVDAGSTYSFTPTAYDADSDELTFAIANRPAWASFNTSTGQLSGTPTNEDAGEHSNIQISVSDGNNGSASLATFAITVVGDDDGEHSDEDADDIADEVENAAPNGGDGNNDGFSDADQANVSSFVDPVTGEYAILEVDEECVITNVAVIAESTEYVDSRHSYPAGLMDFTIDCVTPGFTATVNQYYYGVSDDSFVVRKFNPVAQSYATIDSATISRQTIDDSVVTKATYPVTDGGELDTDGVEDGSITDPAGLALLLATSSEESGNDGLADTGQSAQLYVLLGGIVFVASALTLARATLQKL